MSSYESLWSTDILPVSVLSSCSPSNSGGGVGGAVGCGGGGGGGGASMCHFVSLSGNSAMSSSVRSSLTAA